MNIAITISSLMRIVNLSWLTGPIFDKELRVSSRHRRNYAVRSLYVGLLTLFVAMVWAESTRYGGGSTVWQVSRMSLAGRTIVLCIVWFQFIAAQIIAGVMLSTAISDEVYNRTLGVLMTTPINSFQIVMGKLLSRLLQTILLLAITLPLLAVVRVFGGVPWGYLLAGLCITLTTAIFVGSLSMFYSIFAKRAYLVIILTVLTLVLIFFAAPLMSGFVWRMITGKWPGNALTTSIFYSNPYFALAATTEQMINARTGFMTGLLWQVHCGLMMLASLALLAISIACVRRVALAQIAGGRSIVLKAPHAIRAQVSAAPGGSLASGTIRRVEGNCVHWKEKLQPLFGRSRLISRLLFGLGVVLLIMTYIPVGMEDGFDHEEVQMSYCFILFAIGALFTLVLPATVITSEKEARSWPLLLQTTLSDESILLGKVFAVLKRCAVFWIPLFVHMLIFTVFGCIHPFAIIQVALTVFGPVLLAIGSGVFFSSWFRHTTTAVIANFSFVAIIWGLIPLPLALITSHSGDGLLEFYAGIIPVVQLGIVLEACVPRLSRYYLPGFGQSDAAEVTMFILFCSVAYASMGLLFAAVARAYMRKRVFGKS